MWKNKLTVVDILGDVVKRLYINFTLRCATHINHFAIFLYLVNSNNLPYMKMEFPIIVVLKFVLLEVIFR